MLHAMISIRSRMLDRAESLPFSSPIARELRTHAARMVMMYGQGVYGQAD